MSQLALDLAHAHHNRQLFSNHFLERRLREDEAWSDVAEEADALRKGLRALYDEKASTLAQANEAQTEEQWIRPVLREMGWGFVVQARTQRHGTTEFPDYAMFPAQDAADAAASEPDHRHVLKRAVAVLEAKRWERGLDSTGAQGDRAPNRAPSLQIINYLFRAEQPWGVLTNGGEWRLYYRDADFADTVYFAVDLPALLSDRELPLGEAAETISAAEAFRYFYLFFGPAAFEKDEHGVRWLDRASQRSLLYARRVEEALKPRAYRAVTALCRGLAVGAEVEGDAIAADPALGRTILDNALTLLFRMLFVLYGESRELLPVRANGAYRTKSFLQLRDRARRIREKEDQVFRRGRDLWDDLRDLFAIVDGDPHWRDVGIPIYDGGLFDPAKHPWLETHYVPDPFLAEAMDLLSRARDPETGLQHQVDYAPLDVRHLGSIYEGLLEHVLRVADEDLPPITEKGRRVRDAVPAGELYLATEKGERKASGSYYTPDYVVQYIVERTLEPLVDGRSVSEILALKVLDPAMGSGHFLVAATAYLARHAVRAAEEGDQRLLGEFASLDPEHLRRLVVERCIFGVDKNPRALELAKLALWIATVQKDKPLNFLDHHLKRGDSLLGGRLADLGALPGRKGKAAEMEAAGQVALFESAFRQQVFKVVALVQRIEDMPSQTVEQIHQKEALYAQADAMLGRFRDAADLWASAPFGNVVNDDQYDRAVQGLLAPEKGWSALTGEPWFAAAKSLWREHGFFHWDLEFAEAFFDDQGRDLDNPGFDAVIGNPPYVRMEEFKELKDFLRVVYETHATRTDLYVYFIERSLALLRDGGQYGAILSNKFLRANYGKKVRALIAREAGVREIVDFGGLPVFPEATVRAAVLIASKGERSDSPRLAEVLDLDSKDLRTCISEVSAELDKSSIRGADWMLVPRPVTQLMAKLAQSSRMLGHSEQIGWGIKTGLNEAFIISDAKRLELIDADPNSVDLLKPLVVGSEVRRYHLNREGSWLLYVPHGTDLSRYPAVEAHLEPFRERLEARSTRQEWYELQQPQAGYHKYFETSKILFPDMGIHSRFALDLGGGLYPANTVYFIPDDSAFIVSILNSMLGEWWLRMRCAELEGPGQSYLRFMGQYMERLPIRRIEPRTSERGRREMDGWLQSLYYRGLKVAGLEPEIPDDIRALGPAIGGVEGVERVLLIGSWARGQAGEESDVDVLVVDRPNGRKPERRRRIREHLGRTARSLDLHVYSTAEVERQTRAASSFLSHVLPEAVVLYER